MSHSSPIAREGIPFIVPPVICAIVAVFLGSCIAAILLGLISLFIVWFFRNPERETPADPKIVTSPADGRVIRIEDISDHELLNGPLKKNQHIYECVQCSC